MQNPFDWTMEAFERHFEMTPEFLGCGSFGCVVVGKPRPDASELFGSDFDDEVAVEEIPKTVAIKTILLNTKDPEKKAKQRESVINEASNLMKLGRMNHKIVKLFGYYVGPVSYHLVMEHLTCGTLFEAIAHFERFTEHDATKVVYEIILALNYCHSNGICHRDIKPENILLRVKPKPLEQEVHPKNSRKGGDPPSTLADAQNRYEVVLADFGLSLANSVDTQKVGSRRFMAPEVITANKNSTIDYRKADVWSMGVLAFSLFTGGQMLFAHQNKNDVTKAIAEFGDSDLETLVSKNQLLVAISQECKQFLKNVLQPDFSQRYSMSQTLVDPYFLRPTHKSRQTDISLGKMKEYLAARRPIEEKHRNIGILENNLALAGKGDDQLSMILSMRDSQS